MEYKLIVAQSFEDDLDNVLAYISETLFNPTAASRLFKAVEEKVRLVHENPLLYPLYHDERLLDKGYHYAVISNYLMFYTVDETTKTIFISRFLYGGQNFLNII